MPVVQLAVVRPAAPPLSKTPIPDGELIEISGPEDGRPIPAAKVFPKASDAATVRAAPPPAAYSALLEAPANPGVLKHTRPHAAFPEM
jgi:hypothetical protein